MPRSKKANALKKHAVKKSKKSLRAISASSKASPNPRASAIFGVKSSILHGIHRQLTVVSAGGKESIIRLHRQALVGPSDTIYVDPDNFSRLSLYSTEDPSDLIPLVPHYEHQDHLRLGTIDYDIAIKEIHTQSDLDDYE